MCVCSKLHFAWFSPSYPLLTSGFVTFFITVLTFTYFITVLSIQIQMPHELSCV